MAEKSIIIGGGAAGFFAAIACAEANPEMEVIILEKAQNVLQKVKVSGGGRCNVTHACFVPSELVNYYPRGHKELHGPFSRFHPADTMEWFADRGVELKIEDDGRVFPTTDKSQTIINCLVEMAEVAGVNIKKGVTVNDIRKEGTGWQLKTTAGDMYADRLMVATGGSKKVWDILKKLGHTIVEPVPSLFTFNIKDPRIKGLAGIALPDVEITVANSELTETGPLLITHWGLSGPAVLKLSAWGAFELAHRFYYFPVMINWLAGKELDDVYAAMIEERVSTPRKRILNHAMFNMPLRLWKSIGEFAGIKSTTNWADLSNKQIQDFAAELTGSVLQVSGKSTYKEEFVTAGGIHLNEINFKRFESKINPGLFIAGEALNIDALTGGFNFQAAWTGGWLAGHALAGEEID
jgi:predicted Rossmann fold flavoprotein